jgi:hypothetical protein
VGTTDRAELTVRVSQTTTEAHRQSMIAWKYGRTLFGGTLLKPLSFSGTAR